MTHSWFFWWMIFMVLFLMTPIGYGWGYRGWGVPYPRYIQRRRGKRAADIGRDKTFNHLSWSWGGDVIWLALIIGLVWVTLALW